MIITGEKTSMVGGDEESHFEHWEDEAIVE